MIGDPIMALRVLMNAKLDVFQSARFRYWWFSPTVMDHSGVSVGKSELAFYFVFLRLFLLPLAWTGKPRIVTLYYPSQGTAEEVFLPKVEEYLSKSKVFKDQIKFQHGNRFYQTKKNVIIIQMREGGWCELPAGDFMKDSQNQASKRFNDLVTDETAKMDVLGQGVNKELLQRNTRECFNPNHPVHANHTLFLGHAESPEHPYFKRYRGIVRNISRHASQDHVVITSSYKDFRGEFHRRFGQDPEKKAKQQYLTDLDAAEHAQTWDGLWKAGVKGLYSEILRKLVLSKGLRAHLQRSDSEVIYHLGWDTAGALTERSDWNAGVVVAATRVSVIPDNEPGYMLIDGTIWHVRVVYAVFLHKADVDQKGGLIHRLHQCFGFSGITLDSRGGGGEVYMKLRESRQFINNEWVQTIGLCTPKDAHEWPMAQPIISFYDRGEPLFKPWFGEKFVSDNTGPIDFAHRQMRGIMRKREIAWPVGPGSMDPLESAQVSIEEGIVLSALERALNQFGNIEIEVDKEGNPKVSEKGFQKFTHKGKKDGAMATLYAVHGIRAVIARSLAGRREDAPSSCVGVYS